MILPRAGGGLDRAGKIKISIEMPTISFHAPPVLFKKFSTAARRRRVRPSQFVREAVEEKIQREQGNTGYGFLAGTFSFAPDFDPSEPAIPDGDWKDLSKWP